MQAFFDEFPDINGLLTHSGSDLHGNLKTKLKRGCPYCGKGMILLDSEFDSLSNFIRPYHSNIFSSEPLYEVKIRLNFKCESGHMVYEEYGRYYKFPELQNWMKKFLHKSIL